MADLIKVTGLWKSEDREGRLMLSGNLNSSARVWVFENRFKEQDGENAPDFVMYIGANEPKDEKQE